MWSDVKDNKGARLAHTLGQCKSRRHDTYGAGMMVKEGFRDNFRGMPRLLSRVYLTHGWRSRRAS